jgi:hypothetical protein
MAMGQEIRPEIVLCNRKECMYCVKLQEGIPIEQTREPGFVPAWPTTFEHKCDRKNIVVDKNGNCYSFVHHHPDIMRPAGIRAKGQPSYANLGIEPPTYPSVQDRIEPVHSFEEAYRLGREDEKLGVKVET